MSSRLLLPSRSCGIVGPPSRLLPPIQNVHLLAAQRARLSRGGLNAVSNRRPLSWSQCRVEFLGVKHRNTWRYVGSISRVRGESHDRCCRISSLPALQTPVPLGQEGELVAAPGPLPVVWCLVSLSTCSRLCKYVFRALWSFLVCEGLERNTDYFRACPQSSLIAPRGSRNLNGLDS